MWFPMYGLEDADEATFQAKIDPIVKAIGDQGQVKHSKGDLSEDATPQVAPARTRLQQGTTVFEPTPEPAPARAPAPAQARAPASAPWAPAPAPAPAARPTTPALAPVAPDARSFTPSMQALMSPTSNALGMPYGTAQQVAGSPNTSDTPLGQRLDGSSSSLADLSALLEIMNEREDKRADRMEAREEKHADRIERMLQLQNDSAPPSPSTPGQRPPTEHQQHQGRQTVSNTHDDVSGSALVALMGALGLPGWLIDHRAWLGRIVAVAVLLRWRPLLRLLSRLGGV